MKSYKTFVNTASKRKKDKGGGKVHEHDVNRPDFNEFTPSIENLGSMDNDPRS